MRVLGGGNGRRILIVLIHKHGRDAAGFSFVLEKVLFEVAGVVVGAATRIRFRVGIQKNS